MKTMHTKMLMGQLIGLAGLLVVGAAVALGSYGVFLLLAVVLAIGAFLGFRFMRANGRSQGPRP